MLIYSQISGVTLILVIMCAEVRADQCRTRRRDTTWGNLCLDSEVCNRYCIGSEHGVGGTCMPDGLGFACFCEFIC